MGTEILITPGTTRSRRVLPDNVQEKDLFVLEHDEQIFQIQRNSGRSDRSASTDDPIIEQPTAKLRDFVAFEFSLVPQVDYVYTALRDNGVFYAWILTDKFELPIREAIYKRERDIIDEFPMFEFDFYIIARRGRDVEDLIGDPSVHLTYGRSTD